MALWRLTYYVHLCTLCEGDVVALLVGHRTCYLQVAGSSPGSALLPSGLGASYLHMCASVTKQYKLVPAKGGG